MAPPRANFQEVYAAGEKIANWPIMQQRDEAQAALQQFGTYDFQRDKETNTWFSEYADAANYAVGVYMAGAGYGKWVSVKIAQTWGFFTSSNNTMIRRNTGPKEVGTTLIKESGDKNVEVRQVGYCFHCFGSRRQRGRLDRPSLLPIFGRLRRRPILGLALHQCAGRYGRRICPGLHRDGDGCRLLDHLAASRR